MPLPDPQLVAELALIGTVTGFLAGLLGIGGGMVMVPFVSMILGARGFPPEHTIKIAVATSLATICFTSLSSVRAHHKRGAVRWDIVKVLAPGILAGSLVGAHVAVALPARLLGAIFSLFLVYCATQLLRKSAPRPARGLPGPLGTFAVGGAIGAISAVLGAGGAFMSVPFMTWCNVKIHDAVGTSSALGFPIAFAGTAGYVWAGQGMAPVAPGAIGYLWLPGVVLISLASMALAPLGARTAHSMDIQPLRRAFAVVLYGLAAYFLLR